MPLTDIGKAHVLSGKYSDGKVKGYITLILRDITEESIRFTVSITDMQTHEPLYINDVECTIDKSGPYNKVTIMNETHVDIEVT